MRCKNLIFVISILIIFELLACACGQRNNKENKTSSPKENDLIFFELKGPVKRVERISTARFEDNAEYSASAVNVYNFDEEGSLISMSINGEIYQGNGAVYENNGVRTWLKRDSKGRIIGEECNIISDDAKIKDEIIYKWNNDRVENVKEKMNVSLEDGRCQNRLEERIYHYDTKGERVGYSVNSMCDYNGEEFTERFENISEILEKDEFENKIKLNGRKGCTD